MAATFFPEPVPDVVGLLLKERERLGQDRRDELWEGVLHVAPYASFRHARLEAQMIALLTRLVDGRGLLVSGSFNLGEPGDYRIPEGGVHRDDHDAAVYIDTAALVFEVLSPGDETYDKLPFYVDHGVEEILIVDPVAKQVSVHRDADTVLARSELLDVSAHDLTAEIDWP